MSKEGKRNRSENENLQSYNNIQEENEDQEVTGINNETNNNNSETEIDRPNAPTNISNINIIPQLSLQPEFFGIIKKMGG
ncbi:MAG: hypothetical protein EBS06_09270 [Proteobacteria bacterium]|nr:hypothetical protein [Pseudomonadota bacterium]